MYNFSPREWLIPSLISFSPSTVFLAQTLKWLVTNSRGRSIASVLVLASLVLTLNATLGPYLGQKILTKESALIGLFYYCYQRTWKPAFRCISAPTSKPDNSISSILWRDVPFSVLALHALVVFPVAHTPFITSSLHEPYLFALVGWATMGWMFIANHLAFISDIVLFASYYCCNVNRSAATNHKHALQAYYRRQTRQVTMSPRFPAELDGYRIVMLSDLHIGPTVGKSQIATLVTMVNQLNPQAVVLVGDVVDGHAERLRGVIEPLAQLKARDGVFMVTGNHEHLNPPVQPTLATLQAHNVTVLGNRYVSLPVSSDLQQPSFDLAGERALTADLQAALLGRDPRRELVLLAHQPKHIHQAAAADVGLMLSGHTHGGQMFPFQLACWFANPYLAGLHHHVVSSATRLAASAADGQDYMARGWSTQLYVGKGSIYWGPPMRLMAPAEITELTLRSPHYRHSLSKTQDF
eukprot:g65341.t1